MLIGNRSPLTAVGDLSGTLSAPVGGSGVRKGESRRRRYDAGEPFQGPTFCLTRFEEMRLTRYSNGVLARQMPNGMVGIAGGMRHDWPLRAYSPAPPKSCRPERPAFWHLTGEGKHVMPNPKL